MTRSGQPPSRASTRRAFLERSLAFSASGLLASSCAGLDRLTPRAATTPGATSAAALARRGGTLRISRPGDILPAGAPYVLTAANTPLFTLLYDTLVAYDAQFTAHPRLATSWTWSPDARRLTLSLRPGVKFHTGRPFTSEDAKFNLEHLREPAVGSQWRNYATAMHISTPDPGTLVIDYDAPARASFDALAATFMADSQTLDEVNSGRGFVGTGPFRFREWVPGSHFTVARNPDYWQADKPYLDAVELRIIPDPQASLVALETSNVDWMSGVPGPDARRLQSDSTYQVMLTASGGTFYYVGLDVAHPALADRRVRQAFNYALNRPRMVDTALAGFGRPASILWPRGSVGYDSAQDQTYSFDLARARQLLAAASWDSETIVPLALGSLVALTVPMAEIYQADLAAVGVKLSVQQLGNADFFGRLQTGRFDGAWLTSMAFMHLSPATFLTSAFPVRVPNTSHFESRRYTDLIDQVSAATSDQQLHALVRDTTQVILDESFVLPIAESATTTTGPEVARNAVQNVAWDRFGLFAYENIWLNR